MGCKIGKGLLMKIGLNRFAVLALAGFLASSAFGEIATNKWIATGGGRWNDAANWSNPELLGTPFFADFGELDAEGDGVTIGVSTAKTKVCGMRFKGSSGGWNRYAFKPADDMTEKGFQQELFEFHGANGENSVLDVPTRATVVFSGALKRCSEGATKTDHIEKTGGGMIHFDHAEAPTLGPLWIRDGWLENFTSASLRRFGMRLFPRGLFRLNADLGMGKLVFESTSDFNPIRLNGHCLTFGYGWQDQSFVGNAFTNDERVATDTVSAVGSAAGATVTFAGRQQAKLDLRLNDGDIRFASQQRPLVACFFNDAQSPGKNDGTLADLVTGAGTAQIVNDADRGNVLYLDGATKLIGSDANGNLDGLPTGDGDYTISLWLKIAEDVTNYFAESEQTPTVCALGVRVDNDNMCFASGGYLVQLMPGYSDSDIDLIETNVKMAGSVSKQIADGLTGDEIIAMLFSGIEFEMFDEFDVEYRCNCERDRYLRARTTLNPHDYRELRDAGEPVETSCLFCGKKYKFELDEIEEARHEAMKKKAREIVRGREENKSESKGDENKND